MPHINYAMAQVLTNLLALHLHELDFVDFPLQLRVHSTYRHNKINMKYD